MNTDVDKVTSEIENHDGVETPPSFLAECMDGVTAFLRGCNNKLRDMIAGIVRRASRVVRSLFHSIRQGIVVFFCKFLPWFVQKLWSCICFLVSKRMRDLIRENLLLLILLPVLFILLVWPFMLKPLFVSGAWWRWLFGLTQYDPPVVHGMDYMGLVLTIFGVLWIVFIGAVGSWQGYKHGLYSKGWKRLKAWRDKRRTGGKDVRSRLKAWFRRKKDSGDNIITKQAEIEFAGQAAAKDRPTLVGDVDVPSKE